MRILFLFLTFSRFCFCSESEENNLELSNVSAIEQIKRGTESKEEFKEKSDLNVSQELNDSQIENYLNEEEYNAFLNYLKENLPNVFLEFKDLEYGTQVKLDAIEGKSFSMVGAIGAFFVVKIKEDNKDKPFEEIWKPKFFLKGVVAPTKQPVILRKRVVKGKRIKEIDRAETYKIEKGDIKTIQLPSGSTFLPHQDAKTPSVSLERQLSSPSKIEENPLETGKLRRLIEIKDKIENSRLTYPYLPYLILPDFKNKQGSYVGEFIYEQINYRGEKTNIKFIVLPAVEGEALYKIAFFPSRQDKEEQMKLLHTYHAIGKSMGRFYRVLALSWLKEEGESPQGMQTLIHGDLHANNIFFNKGSVYLIDNESMLDSYLKGGNSIDEEVVRFLFFSLIQPNYFSNHYFKEDLLLHARYILQYIDGFSEEYKNKEETRKYLINIVEKTLSTLIQFTKDVKRNRENISQSSTSLPQVDNKLQEKFWNNKTFEKISSLTREENKLKGNFVHFTTRLFSAKDLQGVVKGLEWFKTNFKALV